MWADDDGNGRRSVERQDRDAADVGEIRRGEGVCLRDGWCLISAS